MCWDPLRLTKPTEHRMGGKVPGSFPKAWQWLTGFSKKPSYRELQ